MGTTHSHNANGGSAGVVGAAALGSPAVLLSGNVSESASASAALERIHSSIGEMQRHYDAIIKKWETRAKNLETALKIERLKDKNQQKAKDIQNEKDAHTSKAAIGSHTLTATPPALPLPPLPSAFESSAPIPIEESVKDVLWLRAYLQRAETNFLQDRESVVERQQTQSLVKRMRLAVEETQPHLTLSLPALSPVSHSSSQRGEQSISASREFCPRCWRPLEITEMKSPYSSFSPYSFGGDKSWGQKAKVTDAMERMSKGHRFVDGKWQHNKEDGDVGSELDAIFDEQHDARSPTAPLSSSSQKEVSFARDRHTAKSELPAQSQTVTPNQRSSGRHAHNPSVSQNALFATPEEGTALMDDSDHEELESKLILQEEAEHAKPITSQTSAGRESTQLREFQDVPLATKRRWSESHSRSTLTPSFASSSSSSSSSAFASLSNSAPMCPSPVSIQPPVPLSASLIRAMGLSVRDLFTHAPSGGSSISLAEDSVAQWLSQCTDVERQHLCAIAGAMTKFSLLRHALHISYPTIRPQSELSGSLLRTIVAGANSTEARAQNSNALRQEDVLEQMDQQHSENETPENDNEDDEQHQHAIDNDALVDLDGFDDDDDPDPHNVHTQNTGTGSQAAATTAGIDTDERPDDLDALDDF